MNSFGLGEKHFKNHLYWSKTKKDIPTPTQNGSLSKASLFDNWSWWQTNGTGGRINSSSIDQLWTNWHLEAGQPNYDGNCARVLGYDYRAFGHWYDGNCDGYNYVICEIEKSVEYHPDMSYTLWSGILSKNMRSKFDDIFKRRLGSNSRFGE